MSSPVSGPPPVQHTLPVHAPIGKPAVGLESVADKVALLPPVEDATDAERLHRRDVVVKLSEDAERQQHHHGQQPDEGESAPEPEPEEAAFVLAAANPYQARHLAEFDAPTPPPGSLLDQKI